MPTNFEFEFSQQDKELILTQELSEFNGTNYIRLTIFPSESPDNIVNLPSPNDDNDKLAVFYSSLNPVRINTSPFNIGTDVFNSRIIGNEIGNDFKIYTNEGDDSIYIKPNDIFDEFGLPQGDYKIQVDFLNQLQASPAIVDTDASVYKFIIKEISTSRKEVRLKLIDKLLTNNSLDVQNIINNLNDNQSEFLDDGNTPNPNFKYQFKHILNIGTGDHIPIMNYTFDKVTDGKDNQSIILKLYQPLPTSISTLSMITIEKEVLTTQTQDIFYFSDVPDVFFGDGLTPQPQENWLNPDNNEIGFQSLDELAISASIGDIEVDSLISSSGYNYPNLNTDFRFYENHTFFGSAKKKLQNFRKKVETIQKHYSDISSSLQVSSSISGDSTFIIQKRKDLFDKIKNEFKTFTPYERFLYFDGQTDSSASAPSLKNYADTTPVSDENITLGPNNGFSEAYDITFASEKEVVNLFTDKYKVQNSPFFNYSSSIYLSFLMIGSSGSAITWENNNDIADTNGLGVPLPKDIKHQKNILNPNITTESYQRYVFETSHSYWIPKTRGNDIIDLSQGDFRAGSTKLTILSGSAKTGSYKIKDSTGKYPTTVVTQSGVPFLGSVMPAGELFRVLYKNTVSSSLQGYWNIDDVESGSALTLANVTNDAGPTTGDATQIIGATASAGVEVHGRQYGTSYYIISASNGAPAVNEGIRFESSNLNFSKDDNFSMAIWVKRFHPDTGSADTTAPAGGDRQEIFMRGSTSDSFGIDYQMPENKFRAGVRSGSATTVVTTSELADDGLNWHHVAFTYESGSSTGLKIYLDGVLENQGSNLGVGEFSSSSPSGTDALSIGETATISSNGRQFNGFLQYPRIYNRTITAQEVNQLYLNPPGIPETRVTDVKVTLENPTNVLPFDNIYHTSSAEWTNWYNNALTEAENFDTNNIHSFENNLPLYIQESSEYKDMKDFLNLQGEKYDLIRNHIDSLGTLHDRGYTKTDSPPDNALPILLSNMGWQAINPISGSLTDILGKYVTSVTSFDDIKNSTWRKTLNNLLYIYKSKGTQNSVRALLNTYGYPPDILKVKEFGGYGTLDKQNINDNPFNDLVPVQQGTDNSLRGNPTGSFRFISSRQKLSNYIFNGEQNRILNLDWWMDSANINTIEFVYKHTNTTQTQTILKSSGSGGETLWDLRLVPSSTGDSSSFEFRLNNSLTGSLAIATNAVSMSTLYSTMTDGQLWNVMLQRMTGSTSTNIINEYRLHSSLQEDSSIKTYNFATMSISGGAATTTNNFANQNWMSSGSRHALSSSNLFVGEIFSGSLAEIKSWATPLSKSKFQQHTLNKFSTIGNSLTSHCDELIYHFKLNENYTSSSISSSAQTLLIVDASPTKTYSDYSITKPGSFFSGSFIYGFDIISRVGLTLSDNATTEDENGIIINPSTRFVGNLNPSKSAVNSLTNTPGNKSPLKVSTKLELYRSPQNFINNFILDKISGFNLEEKYGNPIYFTSSSYTSLDSFRNEFFDCHPILIDTNKFIRTHESMFNHTLTEGLNSLSPARSTMASENSNFGVEIKQTLIEKQKYEHHLHSIEPNPNTVNDEINIISITNVPSAIYNSIKEGEVLKPVVASGSLELPITTSLSLGNSYVTSSGYLTPISQSHKNHFHPPFLQPGGYSASIENPFDISFTNLETRGQKNIPPTLTDSSVPTSKNGLISYSEEANESFTNIHNSWGIGTNDTHFINYTGGTGSSGDYNRGHIDTRFIFNSIGDNEYYSASNSADFSNFRNFYNRKMIDKDFHALISYQSLIGGVSSNSNHIGRMMGKTKFFITSSDGEITLPSNHITNFSQPFKEQMINGTQNTNPGQLNVQYEDYSSASFYRVKVTGGENRIIVNKGQSKLDSNDNIIY
tara:strand:+ start:6921 stop:12569 length:5649 start_codon:yes stop_codon:yes gene_type:complete